MAVFTGLIHVHELSRTGARHRLIGWFRGVSRSAVDEALRMESSAVRIVFCATMTPSSDRRRRPSPG